MRTRSEQRKFKTTPGRFETPSSITDFSARVVHPTFVRTPLIDQLTREKSWKQFTIEPITVANAVVTQVLKGESAQLILPGRYAALSLLRGTSSWLQEGIRNAGKDVLPKS